jgi:4-hydroxy-tetrahydrodipicolinate synthase
MKNIAPGVWPTMITPFTSDDKIDTAAVDQLIEWYIARGVAGIFAVCQSSEMFHLSLDERIDLAARVVERAGGRIQIIASGHISESYEDQAEELKKMAGTGIEALVLLTNRFVAEGASDDAWKERCLALLDTLPDDIPLGFYECPYPFRRDLSPELLAWCAETGRFVFLKDTCSDPKKIEAKLAAVEGTPLKLYNANSASLLATLRMGAAGFSGVMANFHPELYAWLVENWQSNPAGAEAMQAFLGLASVVEYQMYPTNAKYHMQLEGLPVGLFARKPGHGSLSVSQRTEIEQLRTVAIAYRERYAAGG